MRSKVQSKRRGRYRADRPTRLGASAGTSNSGAITTKVMDVPADTTETGRIVLLCWDCAWLGDRIQDGRDLPAYTDLLIRHLRTHGGVS